MGARSPGTDVGGVLDQAGPRKGRSVGAERGTPGPSDEVDGSRRVLSPRAVPPAGAGPGGGGPAWYFAGRRRRLGSSVEGSWRAAPALARGLPSGLRLVPSGRRGRARGWLQVACRAPGGPPRLRRQRGPERPSSFSVVRPGRASAAGGRRGPGRRHRSPSAGPVGGPIHPSPARTLAARGPRGRRLTHLPERAGTRGHRNESGRDREGPG